MIKHATLLTVIGFLLFFLGLVSFILNYVGVDLFFLDWLYRWNATASYVIRVAAMLLGIVLIYVSKTNWEIEAD